MTIKQLFRTRVSEDSATAIRQFHNRGYVQGLRNEEIIRLVAKRKNKQLIQSGQMGIIGGEAENHFRDELFKRDPSLHRHYVSAKQDPHVADASLWAKIANCIDEHTIKQQFIAEIISPNPDGDSELFEEAIRELVSIRTRRIFDRYEKITRRSGLGSSDKYAVVNAFETINRETSDILYEEELQKRLVASVSGKESVHLVYGICLRLTHDRGIPNVTPHLLPFHKTDKNGEQVLQTGENQRYQLEKIIELASQLGELGMEQTVMLADFDAYKYGNSHSQRLARQANEYLEVLRAYLSSNLPVVSEVSFMAELGFDEDLFQEVKQSLLHNTGEFIPVRTIDRERMSCARHRQVSLSPWTRDDTIEYVASSVARKLVEGITFTKADSSFILASFNNNALPGVRYNQLAGKIIPFFSLPRLTSDEMTSW